MALFIYWFSVAIIAYTLIGFVILLVIGAKLFARPHRPAPITPPVTMIIAAYNEEDSIEAKIQNVLGLDYPAELLQVIIASDGSDDRTNEIVQQYVSDQITLLPLPRGGKHQALNAAVKEATGEIFVFSDANSMYAPDAIRKLTQHFADPQVGGVAGDQQYRKTQSQSSEGEAYYWSFDRFLKQQESQIGNVISATGAIYAIRHELYQPVIAGVTDDFYISTGVIEAGSRLVFAPDAIAYETPSTRQRQEFSRKVRVISRGFYSVIARRRLLNPFKYGLYSLLIFTHKILRRLLYIPFILIFLSNGFLLDDLWFYQLTMLAQIAFYGLALLGWLLEARHIKLPKVIALPSFMVLVYVAAMRASWNVIRNNRIDRWTTVR